MGGQPCAARATRARTRGHAHAPPVFARAPHARQLLHARAPRRSLLWRVHGAQRAPADTWQHAARAAPSRPAAHTPTRPYTRAATPRHTSRATPR
eukprot:6029922-Prymnesium_polylepis.1